MEPENILKQFYDSSSKTYEILIRHGKNVANKALQAAEKVAELNPDIEFIKQAAMLHDIGIFLVNAPKIGCTGKYPYICHGFLGREILDRKGLFKLGLVCERHVGVGITVDDIKKNNLPLPQRNLVPVSIEEQIICYADKFYSKSSYQNAKAASVADIKKELKQYGNDKALKFQRWVEMFE